MRRWGRMRMSLRRRLIIVGVDMDFFYIVRVIILRLRLVSRSIHKLMPVKCSRNPLVSYSLTSNDTLNVMKDAIGNFSMGACRLPRWNLPTFYFPQFLLTNIPFQLQYSIFYTSTGTTSIMLYSSANTSHTEFSFASPSSWPTPPGTSTLSTCQLRTFGSSTNAEPGKAPNDGLISGDFRVGGTSAIRSSRHNNGHQSDKPGNEAPGQRSKVHRARDQGHHLPLRHGVSMDPSMYSSVEVLSRNVPYSNHARDRTTRKDR